MEMTVLRRDGQFLTGSFMDYALPRAAIRPKLRRRPSGAARATCSREGMWEAGCAARSLRS